MCKSLKNCMIILVVISALQYIHAEPDPAITRHQAEHSDKPSADNNATKLNSTEHLKVNGLRYSYYDRRAVDEKKDAWTPVNTPQSSSYHVSDSINGADQHREETWDKGVMTGSFATPDPAKAGMWRKVTYKADGTGFHIIKDESMSKDQFNEGKVAAPHTAQVNINNNGGATQYSVNEADLKKPKQERQLGILSSQTTSQAGKTNIFRGGVI